MKKIEMEKQAKAFGFATMKFMETKDLEFEHEFRQFCEMNDCGNYGNNYACPPLCGTPEEMEQKVRKYEHALVFQSRTPVQNIFDDAETKIIKKMHTNKTLHAVCLIMECLLCADHVISVRNVKQKQKNHVSMKRCVFRVFLLTALMQERWQSIVI